MNGIIMEVREISNGYLLSIASKNGSVPTDFYAETVEDVGREIIARCARERIKGNPNTAQGELFTASQMAAQAQVASSVHTPIYPPGVRDHINPPWEKTSK